MALHLDAAARRECPADYDPPARLRSAPANMRIETDVPGAKQVCPRGHRSSAGH